MRSCPGQQTAGPGSACSPGECGGNPGYSNFQRASTIPREMAPGPSTRATSLGCAEWALSWGGALCEMFCPRVSLAHCVTSSQPQSLGSHLSSLCWRCWGQDPGQGVSTLLAGSAVKGRGRCRRGAASLLLPLAGAAGTAWQPYCLQLGTQKQPQVPAAWSLLQAPETPAPSELWGADDPNLVPWIPVSKDGAASWFQSGWGDSVFPLVFVSPSTPVPPTSCFRSHLLKCLLWPPRL